MSISLEKFPKKALIQKIKALELENDTLKRVAKQGYILARTIEKVRNPMSFENAGVFPVFLDMQTEEWEAVKCMKTLYIKYCDSNNMRF